MLPCSLQMARLLFNRKMGRMRRGRRTDTTASYSRGDDEVWCFAVWNADWWVVHVFTVSTEAVFASVEKRGVDRVRGVFPPIPVLYKQIS